MRFFGKHAMTYVSQSPSSENILQVAQAVSDSVGGLPLASRIPAVIKRIVDCIDAIADHYAAWAAYEQLQRLSNAELHRRGLSREILARDVLLAQCRAARSE
jgi:hypothetical protein